MRGPPSTGPGRRAQPFGSSTPSGVPPPRPTLFTGPALSRASAACRARLSASPSSRRSGGGSRSAATSWTPWSEPRAPGWVLNGPWCGRRRAWAIAWQRPIRPGGDRGARSGGTPCAADPAASPVEFEDSRRGPRALHAASERPRGVPCRCAAVLQGPRGLLSEDARAPSRSSGALSRADLPHAPPQPAMSGIGFHPRLPEQVDGELRDGEGKGEAEEALPERGGETLRHPGD